MMQLYRTKIAPHFRTILLLLALICFLTPVLYQAARQPNLGDEDTLRVGLLVLNRFGARHFNGDIAMEAGEWWPYYTPAYLQMLGIGYRILDDVNLVMWFLVAIAYILLLTGFYSLGRYAGLPWPVSLIMAGLSGLYVKSASLTEWTGIRLEMANARNLYLALFPWLILLVLSLYRRQSEGKTWYWLVAGFIFGLVANLHSVTGLSVISMFTIMMIFGVVLRKLKPVNLLYFVASSVPGIMLIFLTTFSVMRPDYAEIGPVSPAIIGQSLSETSFQLTWDFTRANLFNLRFYNWNNMIAAYTLLTLAAVVLLLVSHARHSLSRIPLMLFATSQFFGLLLIMPQDWWVVFVAGTWLRRAWLRKTSQLDHYGLVILTAVNLLTLIASFIAEWFVFTDILPALDVAARSFMRGMRLAYFPMILLSASELAQVFEDNRQRMHALYVLMFLGMVTIGFHETARIPVLDAQPGQWLLIDYWVYGAAFVLLVWNQIRRQSIAFCLAAMILVQAFSRILGSPATDWFTLIVGIIVFITIEMLSRDFSKTAKNYAIAASVISLLVLVLFPFGGRSIVRQTLDDIRTVALRDWSRVDTWSGGYDDFRIGSWIRENLPSGALLVTSNTGLRYYALRPVIGGREDARFLMDNASKQLLARINNELAAALESPGDMQAFLQRYGGDFLVLSDQIMVPDGIARLIHSEAGWNIYDIDD